MDKKTNITVCDIAKLANVSPMTVSRALRHGPKKDVSPQTVKRIEKIASRLNYRPSASARSLVLRKTLNIGFCINHPSFNYYHPIIRSLFIGLKKELQKNGHGLGYYYFDPGEDPDFEHFLKDLHVVDAIIVLGRNLTSQQHRLILDNKIRAISLFDIRQGLYSVVEDDFAAGKEAAGYLKERGFRKVTMITHWMGTIQNTSWNGRTLGFLAGAKEHELEVVALEKEQFWRQSEELPDKWGVGELAPDLVDTLLESGEAGRCVFTASDLYALKLLRQVNERSLRLGEDISILSFDNYEGENSQQFPDPKLTSYQRHREDMGRFIGRLAIGLEERDREAPITFPLSLVERESVGYGPQARSE